MIKEKSFQEKKLQAEVIVVGGGVSGVVSAIAAAREGAETILVHDRSVLGGNASSEVRVHIGGATEHGFHFDARETGIIEEIRLQTAVHDPYNTSSWIDTCLYTKCIEEPHLELILETYIDKVNVKSIKNSGEYETRILSVEGHQAGSEGKIKIIGDIFIDGTGHGTLGHLAGAEYRYGQEGQEEFNESLAPLEPNENVLGASILFKAEDMGRGPINFNPPSWAIDFNEDLLKKSGKSIPGKNLNHKRYWHSDTAGWWWVELGGNPEDYHPIKDNQKIRHDLQAICFGIWNYIKNKHPEEKIRKEAENFEITWIGYVPGHRESRRLVGDYILTQNDLEACRVFEDRIAAGGWSIDLHPGDFWNPLSSAKHTYMEVPYSIPFRSIYSKNIENLIIGSRCLSVTHVAHGSTRLIATLSLCGQAAGTAAHMCLSKDIDPRQLGKKHISQLQQTLLKNDSMLLGVKNQDERDLALDAKITSNSEYPCCFDDPQTFIPLYFPICQRFYLPAFKLDMDEINLSFYLKNPTNKKIMIQGAIRRDDGRHYFTSEDDLLNFEIYIPKNHKGWISTKFFESKKIAKMDSGNYWIYLKPHESETIYWGMNYNHWPGTRIGYYLEQEERWQVLRAGKRVFYDKVIGPRGTFCFKVEGFPSPYPADNINNGYHRPFIGPNLWISKPFKDPYIPPFIRKGDKNEKGNREIIELDDAIKRMKTPQYGHELGLQEIEEKPSKPIEIYISFGKKTTISKLILTCDTDLDNCFPHQNYGDLKIKDWGIIGKAPMCIKNLKIYSKNGQKERNLIKEIEGNFQRRIIINFENEIISDNLIIIPTNNWGFHTFNLYEVRVY